MSGLQQTYNLGLMPQPPRLHVCRISGSTQHNAYITWDNNRQIVQVTHCYLALVNPRDIMSVDMHHLSGTFRPQHDSQYLLHREPRVPFYANVK